MKKGSEVDPAVTQRGSILATSMRITGFAGTSPCPSKRAARKHRSADCGDRKFRDAKRQHPFSQAFNGGSRQLHARNTPSVKSHKRTHPQVWTATTAAAHSERRPARASRRKSAAPRPRPRSPPRAGARRAARWRAAQKFFAQLPMLGPRGDCPCWISRGQSRTETGHTLEK